MTAAASTRWPVALLAGTLLAGTLLAGTLLAGTLLAGTLLPTRGVMRCVPWSSGSAGSV